ncbi:MAG: helicase, partial [Bacillales bacterium]|nr:helicase [Bacillales bacterium]
NVVDIRKNFWDEVKVNTDSFDDYLETIISLRQQTQALSVSQSTHKQAAKRLTSLRRMREIPYFGRIDFIEEGTSDVERIYIGVSTLTDNSGEDFLIYDWRAPISSVYYDYAPGPAEYDTPGGKVSGVLDTKWQYIIRNGVIESIFDTSLTIGDEILQHVLGKRTDKHLHSIVSSIQQEQNQIIRYDKKKLLIVQGAAGSGKTSAALQRIAYLLYKYRGWLRADQIILFSPNAMFNNYVSRVLPELGEENMQQVTFQRYLTHRLGKTFDIEDNYEQMEYVLTAIDDPDYQTRIANIKFKASIQFFEIIKAYRQSLESSGMLFKGIKFRGEWIVSSKEITDRFYNFDTTLKFHNRLDKLTEWLNEKIDEVEKSELSKPWVQEEIQFLSKDDYQKAYKYLHKKGSYTEKTHDDYDKEFEVLSRMVVRRKLKPIRKWVHKLGFINIVGIYKQLFNGPSWINGETPSEWENICLLTIKMLEEGKLLYEDTTPFLLLKELIQGFQMNVSIKHILVDEAQDYSPFQFEFIKRLFPSAGMTVLGDFNQAIFAHTSSDMVDFNILQGLYGANESKTINLQRSYRSTKPIVEFTRKLIHGGDQIIAFERDGDIPVLTQLSSRDELHLSIIDKIAELKSQSYNTIAVICKSAKESAEAYEALCSIDDIKIVKNGSTEYEQGVVIIPAYLAKGIEFDAVIIYNASAEVYCDESLRRLFYTACTRAMHYLHLYSVGKASTFLDGFSTEFLIQD